MIEAGLQRYIKIWPVLPGLLVSIGNNAEPPFYQTFQDHFLSVAHARFLPWFPDVLGELFQAWMIHFIRGILISQS